VGDSCVQELPAFKNFDQQFGGRYYTPRLPELKAFRPEKLQSSFNINDHFMFGE
jgi:hypothetical protein